MSKEIKERIDKLNQQLEEAMDPTTFVLNSTATAIFREIDKLQKQCQHSFVNKECQYCGWREDNE
jgi:hypothetical protein